MTKVSASTLARRAATTKNPALAKRYRAEAAKLRREEREAKAFQAKTIAELDGQKRAKSVVRRINRASNNIEKTLKGIASAAEIGGAMNQALYGDNAVVGQSLVAGAQNSLNQMRAASVDSMALHPVTRVLADAESMSNQPGRGEIVGGYLAHMAEELAKLARKKGGVDAIQGRLMTLEHQNRHDEKFYARQREQKAVQAIREEMRDKFVCGFIARFDASEAATTVPTAVIMAGDEIRNIIDALKANGYTAAGKR